MPFPRAFSMTRRLGQVFAICSLLTGAAAAQTSVQIHQIMTNLPNSPYLGQTVSVSGIVVGVMSTGGFYIAAPAGSWDSDATTAEGMPVFSTLPNPACAAYGSTVTIVGTVSNGTAVNAANTPGTGITPSSCTITGTGAITQNTKLPTTLTAFGQLLQYTGMPFSNSIFNAISPTGGTLDEPNEIVTSNGQFWADLAVPANGHLFRTAGIALDENVPPTAPATVTRWDGNPERVLVDTTTFGGPAIDIGSGQQLSCALPANTSVPGIGLVDYTLGYARLLIFPGVACGVTGSITPAVSAPADAQHFHVGSLNLYRFYNTTGSAPGSVAITPAAYQRRLAKAAIAITTAIGQPDILALEEVQDLSTLTDISNAVNTLAGTSYTPYLAVGNDPNSLNMGFLVNTSTVIVDSFTQVGLNSTYTTASGGSALLWERPPQVLMAEVKRAGLNYQVTVIHQDPTVRDNIGDPILGPDIRARRAAQAGALSQLAQAHQTAGENLLVAGNFNEYSFNDGYVDLVDVIVGSPAPASQVTLYEPTSTTSVLYNFEGSVAAATKYNIIESGNARSIEHMLVSQVNIGGTVAPLSTYATTITQSHFTTDFPAVLANSSTTAAGLTPHDGFVAAFLIPPVSTYATISPSNVNFGSIELGLSTTQTVTITNTTAMPSVVVINSIAISGANAGDFTQASNCVSLTEGASCTITLTFAPTAVGVRNGTLTVSTDSPNNPTLTATLTGIGLDTTVTLTPSSADFGSIDIGATSAPQTFTLSNDNLVQISVSFPSITGDFAIASSSCGGYTVGNTKLPPGATCTVTVTFSPTAAGARTGTLSIPNTSTANRTLTATLTGTGLDTTATLTPPTVTFAATDITGTSAAQTVTFTNTSTAALTIGKVSITGDFTQTATTCGTSVTAGAACTYTLVFSPTVVGARTGVFTVLNSSTGTPTLTVTLNGTGLDTTATIAATTATYPATDIGRTSAAQTFTVTNTSTVGISVSKFTLTGDYAQTATTCGATLAASATCTVSVDFVPTAAGVRTGTLTVANNSTADPALVVQLTGTGLDTTATLTPTSADFGSIYAGGGLSAAKIFTLTNTSAIAISVKTITIAGAFTQTNNCGATLTSGASCTISVVFAPLASGPLTGTLTVANSTTANPTLIATLTGIGLPTTASFLPVAATYPNTIVSNTSAPQTFVWTNTSAIPLTIKSVGITGDFAISANSCSGLIAANASCSVAVIFTPTVLGARTGTLTIVSTSSANGTLTATLSGRGVADVEASVAGLSFGNVDVGSTAAPQTFTITNYTAASIALTSILITGDYAYNTTCGATIAGLSTCTVTVTFTPTAIGVRAGAMTINTNDTKYPVILVSLTGNGVDFSISATPASGSTIAGYYVNMKVTLTPLGGFSAPITLSCTTNAGGSLCTPSSSAMTLTGVTVDPVQITTTAQYTVIGYSGFGGNHPWLALLSLLSAGAIFMRFRKTRAISRLALTLGMLILLTSANLGCSGKLPDKNADPTLPGTYTYTFSATDGTITHTATYSLTVTIN